jgi:hypothetical protein
MAITKKNTSQPNPGFVWDSAVCSEVNLYNPAGFYQELGPTYPVRTGKAVSAQPR